MTRETLPTLVDSHAHLTFPEFEGSVGETITRARDSGVRHILTVGTSLDDTHACIELAERYEEVYAAGGIHPNYVSRDWGGFEELTGLFAENRLAAVGETGLDFYRDHTPRENQVSAFRAHLELALRRDLPVIIHVRDAYDEALAVIDELGRAPRGVFHCFSGDAAFAEEALSRGFFISLAGQVTFKKAEALREVAAGLPLGRLLVETDCPYLAPVPVRGKQNEPAFVRHTALKVAEVLGVAFAEFARATTANAWRLFGIGEKPAASVAYEIGGNLYLNITNRCTNACPWCVRFRSQYLRGYNLVLEREPDFEEITSAIGDVTRYEEVVFCGYGEPTQRLDMLKEVATWLHERGARVRLDTNGLGSLSTGRDVVRELAGLVDAVSVSLNTADSAQYDELCRPQTATGSHEAVLAFIRSAKQSGLDVTATAVSLPGVDLDAARDLAASLGVSFRKRKYRPYG